MTTPTLARLAQEFVYRAGGFREAARQTGISPSYLSRLASGERVSASDKVLDALGIERVVTYRRKP